MAWLSSSCITSPFPVTVIPWRSTLYTWDGWLTPIMRTAAPRQDLAALVKRVYIHSYLLEFVGVEEARARESDKCSRN